MAHRLLPLVAAVLLLAIGQRSEGQTTTSSPTGPTPKTGQPLTNKERIEEIKENLSVTPESPIKELSQKEIDALIKKAFGPGCEEMQRPIRFFLADLNMVVAAKEASVGRDGRSVRFTTVSVGFVDQAQALFGEEAVIATEALNSTDQVIKQWGDLGKRGIASIELQGKNSTVAFTRRNGVTIKVPVKVREGDKIVEKFVEQALGGVFEVRFKFTVDPKAQLRQLLPTPPHSMPKLPHWTNEDLAKVSELTFGEPISKELSKHNAMEKTAHVMAKINHLNAKKRDGFMLAMLEQRPDLRGLPFLMGDECRTREEQAKVFAMMADSIRQRLRAKKREDGTERSEDFWLDLEQTRDIVQQGKGNAASIPAKTQDRFHRATVAASVQILMPESEHFRYGLAKHLATIPHIDATKALARLAIFSPEDEVRAAAIEGLKLRRERDYTDVLLHGFRYPLPAVSKRAAEAMVKLERKDLLANLVEVLESPDPRLPVTEKRDGKDVTFVRELVKVNHHRNCLLCHAPGNTDNTPEGVLKVAVPLPSEPLPKPSEGGGYQSTPPPTPDIVVRLDMTYLRQDFSVMMPVSDAHPWPEMQRFDFLVRTRTLTAAEAQAYEECCEVPEPGRLSPYHRSALYALRELTGRDTEPTAAAWRKLLKLPAR
jgi:hypothetical protein